MHGGGFHVPGVDLDCQTVKARDLTFPQTIALGLTMTMTELHQQGSQMRQRTLQGSGWPSAEATLGKQLLRSSKSLCVEISRPMTNQTAERRTALLWPCRHRLATLQGNGSTRFAKAMEDLRGKLKMSAMMILATRKGMAALAWKSVQRLELSQSSGCPTSAGPARREEAAGDRLRTSAATTVLLIQEMIEQELLLSNSPLSRRLLLLPGSATSVDKPHIGNNFSALRAAEGG